MLRGFVNFFKKVNGLVNPYLGLKGKIFGISKWEKVKFLDKIFVAQNFFRLKTFLKQINPKIGLVVVKKGPVIPQKAPFYCRSLRGPVEFVFGGEGFGEPMPRRESPWFRGYLLITCLIY